MVIFTVFIIYAKSRISIIQSEAFSSTIKALTFKIQWKKSSIRFFAILDRILIVICVVLIGQHNPWRKMSARTIEKPFCPHHTNVFLKPFPFQIMLKWWISESIRSLIHRAIIYKLFNKKSHRSILTIRRYSRMFTTKIFWSTLIVFIRTPNILFRIIRYPSSIDKILTTH